MDKENKESINERSIRYSFYITYVFFTYYSNNYIYRSHAYI